MKFVFSILVTVLFLATVSGQKTGHNDKMKEKVNAHKVAFITEKLALTESESQKFWPVYNNYQAEKEKLKYAIQQKQTTEMSDKEADEYLTNWLDYRVKEVELQKKFINRLRSSIPPRKVVQYFNAERAFKEEILSKVQDRCRN